MACFEPPGDCPSCGEFVPARAAACPHCGADERTGWSDETYLDGVDLPGEGHDYERIMANEFPSRRPRGLVAWLALGLALLLALILAGVWWSGR
jgi:hypothetical protein